MNEGLMLGGGFDPRLTNGDVQEFLLKNPDTGEVRARLKGCVVSEIQYRIGELSLEDKGPVESFRDLMAMVQGQARSLGCQVVWSHVTEEFLELYRAEGFVLVSPMKFREGETAGFVLKSLRSLEEVSREAKDINFQRRRIYSKAAEKKKDENLWARAEKFSRLFSGNTESRS